MRFNLPFMYVIILSPIRGPNGNFSRNDNVENKHLAGGFLEYRRCRGYGHVFSYNLL